MVVGFGHLVSICIYKYILKDTGKELPLRQEEIDKQRKDIVFIIIGFWTTCFRPLTFLYQAAHY